MVVGKRVREGNFYRERQFNPNQCQRGTFRNIPLGKGGERGVICRRKGQKTTSLQSKLTPVRAHVRRGRMVRRHARRVR